MMNSIDSTFLKLLKIGCVDVYATEVITELTPDNYQSIVDLARKNHVCAIIYSAISNIEKARPLSEAEKMIRKSLSNDFYKDVYFDVQQKVNLDALKKALSEEKIPFAFVKGAVLKNDYPESVLRRMSDVDVCIFAENRDRFRDVMKKMGALETDIDGNDPNFSLNNVIRIETHGYTFFKRGKHGIEEYENRELSEISSGSLSEEAFAINLIGHMIKHFCKDQLQVHHILDLWIYRHRHTPQPNWEIVETVLEKDGFKKMAENLVALGEMWLGNESDLLVDNSVLCELSDMCIHGNGISVSEYRALNDIAFAGSKSKVICSNLFLSKKEYEKRYPWVKKCIFLLPIAFVFRLVSSLRNHSASINEWLSGVNKADKRAVRKQQEKLRKFGL